MSVARERESSCLRIRKLTPKELLFYSIGLCGIIETNKGEYCDERLRTLLPILWQEISKEEIWKQIRRFWGFQKEKVLRCELYEKSILKSWEQKSNISCGSQNSPEYNEISITTKSLRDLWEKWKVRYTPQRWELQEQQFRQFNVFVSQLPYENTQEETNLCDLWETDESTWLLQQTLFEIQEIWQSSLSQKQSCLRIRKLSPLECLKLMGFTDEDYNAMKQASLSDSAIYHCAGDSIVVSCLIGLFAKFYGIDHTEIIADYVKKMINTENKNLVGGGTTKNQRGNKERL